VVVVVMVVVPVVVVGVVMVMGMGTGVVAGMGIGVLHHRPGSYSLLWGCVHGGPCQWQRVADGALAGCRRCWRGKGGFFNLDFI
jgi:hypothetical protein